MKRSQKVVAKKQPGPKLLYGGATCNASRYCATDPYTATTPCSAYSEPCRHPRPCLQPCYMIGSETYSHAPRPLCFSSRFPDASHHMNQQRFEEIGCTESIYGVVQSSLQYVVNRSHHLLLCPYHGLSGGNPTPSHKSISSRVLERLQLAQPFSWVSQLPAPKRYQAYTVERFRLP